MSSLTLVPALALAACHARGAPQKDASEQVPDADVDASAVEADAAEVEEAGPEPDAGLASDAALPVIECLVTAPTGCPPPVTRYTDVEPIFASRCLSCHDGKGDEWPLTTYSHVASWFNELQAVMTLCSMPPIDAGIDMPSAERELILRWLRCGFPQ